MRALIGGKPKLKRPEVAVEAVSKTATKKKRSVLLIADLRPTRQQPKGPGPSKLLYRLIRAWNKIWVRRAVMVALPITMLVLLSWHVISDPRVQAFVTHQRQAVINSLAKRPEFAIQDTVIVGASPHLAIEIGEVAQLPDDASTLTFDIEALQGEVEGLAAVKTAEASLSADGVLTISVRERIPEALWRDDAGEIWQVDRDGVAIARAITRDGYPDLPMVLGAGAPEAMGQALQIFYAVPDLHPRLRALVRVGHRRWNVALDRGLTILLPEDDPAAAMGRVMAWHYGEEVLDRGLIKIDMRLPMRPVLRLHPKADEIHRLRNQLNGEGEET